MSDMELVREFGERREEGNRRVLEAGNLPIRRFFAIDHDVYAEGALSRREKELQGLVASAVLRCNDCIAYHLRETHACGVSRAEVTEALSVALVVGGSIVIPHIRYAFACMDELWGRDAGPGPSGAAA